MRYKIKVQGYDRFNNENLGIKEKIIDTETDESFLDARNVEDVKEIYQNLDFEQFSSVREKVLEVKVINYSEKPKVKPERSEDDLTGMYPLTSKMAKEIRKK